MQNMRRRWPRRGQPLSTLGFGGAQAGNLYRAITHDEAAAAVDAAWSVGMRYFDTAPHYGLGLSERRMGRALSAYPRDEYVLSTKVGRLLAPQSNPADVRDDGGFDVPAEARRVWDFSRDGILRSLDASLERLGLDRVDVLYLHDCDEHAETAMTESAAALVELREQGVIGAWGAGLNHAPLAAEIMRRCDVDVMMLAGRLTLLDHTALEEVIPLAEERGVDIVAAGVYNSGLISRSEIPADAKYDYVTASPELVERARRIASICRDHGVELPAAALQFPARFAPVVSTVVGIRTAAQAYESAERAAVEIPEQLWTDIADASTPARDQGDA
jgi:D-threo-aldose 1-dehydrogenase